MPPAPPSSGSLGERDLRRTHNLQSLIARRAISHLYRWLTMSSERCFFIGRGSHQLAAVLHSGRRPARHCVVLAHGFTGNKGEHARLFVDTGRALAAAGMDALRFDFMGSGDSTGDFVDMTPNTEIADLHAVIKWAGRRYSNVGVLGLSFGGAVAICATSQRPAGIAALCTWSAVPSFAFWMPKPAAADLDSRNVSRVGRRFFSDRPKVDVPAAYAKITCPKLQIQGDADLPGFREEFARYFPSAPGPKRHLVLRGADHVFTRATDRRRVINKTVRFFRRQFAAS